jgi:hypothetical protein
MLDSAIHESSIESESMPVWPDVSRETQLDWRTVDRALRVIRRSRAALDAEEMYWLREAEALQIWRPLGMVSALDYLERELGYAPRTAQDRLRVARALGTLPQLTTALAGDELSFSAVRELTRVATPATEAAWVAAAAGKNLRQIEELVAEHRPGDRPDDPPDPEARTHVVRFELAAETFALLRQARTVLNDEHGTNLSEDAFVSTLCHAVLHDTSAAESTGRAKFQIAVTVCRHCQRGWQDGAGAQVPIDPDAVERAMCDAQHIGSIDGSAPDRAYQDIPPRVARLVWHRDGGRCRVPGCRSSRGLELHHLVHRADGGSHDAMNLILTCSACHIAHHRGTLTISGTADHLEVRRTAQSAWATERRGSSTRADSIANASDSANSGFSMETAAAHVGAVNTTFAEPAVHGAASVTRLARSASGGTGPASNMEARVRATSGSCTALVEGRSPLEKESPVVRASVSAGGDSKLDTVILRTQAKAALIGLGWKPAIAHAAIAAAVAVPHSSELTLERLIFESLRRCPVPKA